MTDVPIACSLDAGSAADRRRLISLLWSDALIAAEPVAAGMRARLRNAPGIVRRARELIAAEARCCPFLAFDLRTDEAGVVLEITGPRDAHGVIKDFFDTAVA
jgi:MerR family copper efflux transcriptional regulator